jgi:hypothetical protein
MLFPSPFNSSWFEQLGLSLETAPALSLPFIHEGQGLRAGELTGRMVEPGMDVIESRLYREGDPIRLMNWRLMARTGEAYIKYAPRSLEQRALLIIDVSASMWQGTGLRLKVEQAVGVAFSLAKAVLPITVLDTQLWRQVPQSLPVLRGVGRWQSWQESWLAALVQQQTHHSELPLSEAMIVREQQWLMVVSDLSQWDAQMQSSLLDWASSGQVLLVHVLDRREVVLPIMPSLQLSDYAQTLNLSADNVAAYNRQMQQWLSDVGSWCAAMGVHYWPLWADADLSELSLQTNWDDIPPTVSSSFVKGGV